MTRALFLLLSIYSCAVYSLCKESKFSDGSSKSLNGHTVRIFSKEIKDDYYSYFVEIDGSLEQVLTHVKKEDCGWGIFEPSGILDFTDVSTKHSIYQFRWYYNPNGSAYAGKYFCFMYMNLGEQKDILYNSCSHLIDEPGLPSEMVGFDIKDGQLQVTNDKGEVVFEKNL